MKTIKRQSIMMVSAESASSFMKMLSHPHRLMIVCRLLDGQCSVGQLADHVGLRISTMSQHLAQLRRAGIVQSRRDAQTVYYDLDGEVVRDIMEVVSRHFCAPARGRMRG